MIVEKNFLNKLKEFGLNSYEAKLWTALLSRGISSAGELSDISNVPRSRTYDVLESLEKKGFIIMKLGKPIKYIAVHPTDVVERIKKKLKEDAEKETSALDELKESKMLAELNLLHKKGIELVDASDLSGSLKSRNHVYNHLESLIKSAEKSIVITTTAEGLVRKADALKNVLERAKKKGVAIKIAAQINKESLNAAKEISNVAEIKHVDNINARFVIIDGKEVVFMLLNDKEVHPSYDTGIWVNTPFFAKALENMFNQIWTNAEVKVLH